MNTATFDTHQAVKAIADSGLNDIQAEVIVATINNAMNQNFATKSDVIVLKADIKSVKADIESVKTELKAEILVLKWMVGLIIAVEVLPFLKFLLA